MPGVFIRGRHRKLSKKSAAVAAGGMAAAFVAGDIVTAAGSASAMGADDWSRLRACESGGNYGTNTGNGYYGAYQFAAGTWHALGYSGLPSNASPATQDEAARRLQARSGWGQWPACSRRLGLRGTPAGPAAPARASRSAQ